MQNNPKLQPPNPKSGFFVPNSVCSKPPMFNPWRRFVWKSGLLPVKTNKQTWDCDLLNSVFLHSSVKFCDTKWQVPSLWKSGFIQNPDFYTFYTTQTNEKRTKLRRKQKTKEIIKTKKNFLISGEVICWGYLWYKKRRIWV